MSVSGAVSIILLLFGLLAIRAPIGFAMAIAGGVGLYWVGGADVMVGIFSTTPYESAAVYEFVAIPMFLLMAEFVLRSGIADDLFRVAAAWFGRLPGGLGAATAIAGAGFGAISGSSTAAAATLSSTSIPAMRKHGYERRMAAGVVAISGTLAMLIPPSIAMIIYGLIADLSIGKLIVAAIVPSIIVTLTIVGTTCFMAWRDPSIAPLSEAVPWAEKIALLRLVGPMLLLFLTISMVIYTGVATPTEASAFGALVAGILYYLRAKPTFSEFYSVVARATRTTCMIGIILLGAHIFSTFFVLTQTTQALVTWVSALPVPPWSILLVLIGIYILLGCFMDQMAVLVLTVPIVAPLVVALGFDPIWFAVLVIVTVELGMVTPPLGLNCFVVAKYSDATIADVFIGVLPHVLMHLVALAILFIFPVLTLWLPNQM